MKKIRLAVSTVVAAMAASFTVMAGAWKSDANGWWYDEGNGSYPKSTWSWIDGNNDGVAECYYFDPNGYCLINTITPDYYYVNPSGAWVINGVVQTKEANTSSGTGTASSTDIVTGKITIGEKKDKSNNSGKNSSKNNNEDDYDEYEEEEEVNDTDEVDDEDNKDSEEKKSSSSKKSSSKKSGNNKFYNNLDMFDLPVDASKDLETVSGKCELRGMDWNTAKRFHLGCYWAEEAYADYYIGGDYKELTIKATPETYKNSFDDDAIVDITVTNAETGDILYSKKVTADSKLINIKADVTGVDYVRINCNQKSNRISASVLMKDAILTR